MIGLLYARRRQTVDGKMVLRQSKNMVASEKKVVRLGGKKTDSIHEALILRCDGFEVSW